MQTAFFIRKELCVREDLSERRQSLLLQLKLASFTAESETAKCENSSLDEIELLLAMDVDDLKHLRASLWRNALKQGWVSEL